MTTARVHKLLVANQGASHLKLLSTSSSTYALHTDAGNGHHSLVGPLFTSGGQSRTTPAIVDGWTSCLVAFPMGLALIALQLWRNRKPRQEATPLAILPITSEIVNLPTPAPNPFWFLVAPFTLAWIWLSAYYRNYLSKLTVYVTPGSHLAALLDQCNVLRTGYRPTLWCTNGHLQTILTGLFRSKPEVDYHREIIQMNDSGTVALDWTTRLDSIQTAVDGGKPIVIILHGVTGGSKEGYVGHVAADFQQKGWPAVVFNQRGCGDSEITSPKAYCGAASDDCAEVIANIHKRFPKAQLFAVGFSLGANILVKYLGESGDKTPLRAAVSVGNPLDMLRCARLIDQGIRQTLYSKSIARKLKKYVTKHRNMLATVMDFDAMDSCTTVFEFDDRLTAPAFGFNGAEDYYRKASSVHKLHAVRVPLLCINSEDDPIAPGDGAYAAYASDSVAMVNTACGGHLAWLEGWWPFGMNWADRLLLEFFDKALAGVKIGQPVTV